MTHSLKLSHFIKPKHKKSKNKEDNKDGKHQRKESGVSLRSR